MLRTKLEELEASDKHLKDELERALKKEEVTVQSETSTALSDSTEMEASRSMAVEGLGGKEEIFCMTCATPPEPFCYLGLCWQKRMVQSKQAGAVFLSSDLLDILDMNSAP